MRQKYYAVIPKHSFARLTRVYQVINQVTVGSEDNSRVSGWVLLESDFSDAEAAEVLEVGGSLFPSDGEYHDWKAQLENGTLREVPAAPLQLVVPMPSKDGYTRDVRNIGTFQAGTDAAEMVLYVQVRSYLDRVEQPELRREAHLVANNHVRIPQSDGSDVGEYDHLLNAINQASDLKQVIASVLHQRASDGTIDRRLA
jgi:hypothetical protein